MRGDILQDVPEHSIRVFVFYYSGCNSYNPQLVADTYRTRAEAKLKLRPFECFLLFLLVVEIIEFPVILLCIISIRIVTIKSLIS